MQKIIFLDIDGVLNREWDFTNREQAIIWSDYDPVKKIQPGVESANCFAFAQALKRADERSIDWHIVVSSSWRCLVRPGDEKALYRFLARVLDLSPQKFVGVTPRGSFHGRDLQIMTYIQAEGLRLEQVHIIDDVPQIFDPKSPLIPRILFTNPRYGFTEKDGFRLLEELAHPIALPGRTA